MTNGRQPTSTSNFGAGKRESHDATPFYERFATPVVSSDDAVVRVEGFDEPRVIVGDARSMADVPDGSVALVVTSPPYFAGKQYEEDLDAEHVPASYLEYLQMLHDVFADCVRVLEPGGRIAVNVANLGRKPYRSLASDVIHILQDQLRLLLRGEVIWKKAEGATGSVAWGSYRSAANPVLRDLTERVVIASKGRFDRALSPRERERRGLPHVTNTTADEFMAATLDVWDIPSESARRVNHPAPFPVGLPKRLIRLYTYEDDLVLDPFLGSGTSLVAAVATGRRGVGYDLDPKYADIARMRIAEQQSVNRHVADRESGLGLDIGTGPGVQTTLLNMDEPFQARAAEEGKAAHAIAARVLETAGFEVIGKNKTVNRGAVRFNLLVADMAGQEWFVDVSGAFTAVRGGLRRSDTLWKALGRASVLAQLDDTRRLLFMTSHLPKSGSEGDKALRAVGPGVVFDVVEILDEAGSERLALYAKGDCPAPLPGFWDDETVAAITPRGSQSP